jgi:hypothetical protein
MNISDLDELFYTSLKLAAAVITMNNREITARMLPPTAADEYG